MHGWAWQGAWQPSVQVVADASEDRRLREWLGSRQVQNDLRRAIAEAERAADAAVRLELALRFLR